jgi:formylglycine-generating enzyme required for sulfatase activity
MANSRLQPSPVGRLKPNDFGLFDIFGNELEWCQESHVHMLAMKNGSDTEDTAPVTNESYRVLVGGAYLKEAAEVRADRRETAYPQVEYNSVSFRIARTCPRRP